MPHFLLVENCKTYKSLVCDSFKPETGLIIDSVSSSLEAYSLCSTKRYCGVAVDYLLDRETAEAVILKIRETTMNKQTPIMVWSALNDYLSLMENYDVRTAAKPSSPKGIREEIRKTIFKNYTDESIDVTLPISEFFKKVDSKND